jgi:hypothetical protein
MEKGEWEMIKMCKNCIYFFVAKPKDNEYDTSDDTYSQCRRYAPHAISGVGTGSSSQLFARIEGDSWCGEYKDHEVEQ